MSSYAPSQRKQKQAKTIKTTADFAVQIAEKQSAKEAAAAEIASINANIHALKANLKTKKAELKSIDKEIARIEAKKVKAETKAAESAKKAEAEAVLKKLLASGMTADEILAKLKYSNMPCGRNSRGSHGVLLSTIYSL